jgi:hypothetical protein
LFALIARAIVAAEQTTSEDHIVEVLTPSGAAQLPVEVRVGDKDLRQCWGEWFARWFAWLDRNHDQKLSDEELQRIPQANVLRALWCGDFDNLAAKFVSSDELLAGAKTNYLTSEELFVHYCRQGLVLPQLSVTKSDERARDATRWLFTRLADATGSITMQSLAGAHRSLAAADENDDERWTTAELQLAASIGRSVDSSDSSTKSNSASTFRLSTPAETGDNTPDGDQGRVIRLNALTVHMDEPGRESLYSMPSAVIRMQTRRGQAVQQFEFSRQSLFQQCEGDDINRDGFLDDNEIKPSSSSELYANLCKLISADAKPPLRLSELESFLAIQKNAVSLQLVVSAQSYGRPPFSALDANDDGALSLRELSEGWPRLKSWDVNGDARLTWDEIPIEYRLAWSSGRSIAATSVVSTSTKSRIGPPWFANMDRNHDGDLSLREFLGRLEDFQRLDADRDGLISAVEAQAAKRP